jgi:hypothetical protein
MFVQILGLSMSFLPLLPELSVSDIPFSKTAVPLLSEQDSRLLNFWL